MRNLYEVQGNAASGIPLLPLTYHISDQGAVDYYSNSRIAAAGSSTDTSGRRRDSIDLVDFDSSSPSSTPKRMEQFDEKEQRNIDSDICKSYLY